MATIDELRKVRLEKLESLKKLGIDPYPGTIERSNTVTQARDMDGKSVAIAGRVIGFRGQGKIYFFDIVDGTGKIQVAVKVDTCDTKVFDLIGHVDLGDFLSVQGEVGKTVAGEVTVFAKSFRIITKALRPLPSKWHGLKDVEERYRQRYVDLLVNPPVRDIFLTRSKVVRFLRSYLDRDGFLEVETPVLQPIYGGASARPFSTHHNALDTDLYLRISDELYLKRLIIGGFDKVYEIGKDFRNEGIDRQHNPEFTMLEFYWAYADYEELMRYTEAMLVSLVKEVKGSYEFSYQGQELDFTPPWPRKTYRDVVLAYSGIDINSAGDEKKLLAAIRSKKITLDLSGVVGFGALLDTLYKATARRHLVGPMFLTDRPTAFVTLAKRRPDDPSKTASFQLLVAGKEVINAYNELNDPMDQASRWQQSEKLGKEGQDEHEAFDDDYIRALEYGMPPTAGWGMGIDRLVSILTDQASLKEVILFPTLRPETLEIKVESVVQARISDGGQSINREQALTLLHTHMQNPNLRRHCYAVGIVMKALAQKFGGNEEVWEVVGLLHDGDYEETKSDPSAHTLKMAQWIKETGETNEEIIHAILSHNFAHTGQNKPQNNLEWALYCCDELTGFIVAVALVKGKSLANVTVEGVLKKFSEKNFAAGVHREQIKTCEEKLGIKLEKFVGITLKAMQEVHQQLGL